MSIPVVDHTAAALARMAEQYKSDTNFQGIFNAICGELQEVEVALQDTYASRALASASGEQLDLIGRIIGQEREGSSDANYLWRLKARILANRSSGTVDELEAIFLLLVNDSSLPGNSVEVFEYPPASLEVFIGLDESSNAETIARFKSFLKIARSAGIGAYLRHLLDTPANTFTFNGTVGQAWGNGVFCSSTKA